MTGPGAPGSDPVTKVTLEDAREAIRETLGSDASGIDITDDSRLNGLGLSSLEVVEVFFALESASGREIDSSLAAEVETVGELLAVINAGSGG